MSLIEWIITYLILLLFWLWVIKWGGAERLEGTFTSGMLIHIFAIRWSALGIKLFASVSLIISTIFFSIGIFFPELRLFNFLLFP